MKKGKVYIIGAGPGDPGLITLKAVECLRKADVVVYDYLVCKDLLLHADKKARLIYAGKRGKDHTIPQKQINTLLVGEASAGNVVARLKGGDPFLFGRGGEEAEALAAVGIPFEVIPGVTSAISVPAYAGIPLTHRGCSSTMAFVTGHEDPTKEKSDIDWKALAGIGTVVFLMGVKSLPSIAANLMASGKDPATPVALIRWGTTPDQETLVSTLGEVVRSVEERRFRPPAVLVIGSVVELRDRINWFELKPLFGRGIVITRPREQAGEFAALLRAQGARVIHFPTIKIVPVDEWRDLDRAIGQIGDYRWIVFTSANGVGCFFGRMRELGRDLRDLKGARICAIGPATAAAVESRGIRVDLVPESFISEGIIAAFRKEDIRGARVLLPRAEVARNVIPDELAKLGAQVDVVTVYRTVSSGQNKAELEQLLDEGKVDAITFTSSSTVKNFVQIMGHEYSLPARVKIACIGPVTAATATKAGLPVDIMEEKFTIPGLVEGLVNYFSKLKGGDST